jgi:hypothetical protein
MDRFAKSQNFIGTKAMHKQHMHMNKYRQVNDTVELCIRPELEPELKKIFALEMQQGFQGVLQDGRRHYLFTITDDKASLLYEVSHSIHHFECELIMNQYLS